MSAEDKQTGARNAFAFFFGYANKVAQEIGVERAKALANELDVALGSARGRMIKEKASLTEFDARSAADAAVGSINEDFGFTSNVIEESRNKFVIRCGSCPVYDASRMMGMDHEAIEAQCRTGPLSYMNAMVKALNPKLSYQLRRFRSSADDSCEEVVIMD